MQVEILPPLIVDNAMTSECQPQGRSLHDRILSDLESKILAGKWPPGYRIPFEHELTVEYSCSRMTVNKAIVELVKRGLIERRRRSGSFVTRPHSQAAVMEIHDIQREVQSLGMQYSYVLLKKDIRKATAEDCRHLNLTNASDVIALKCCHYADNIPFCLEERLINVEGVPLSVNESFEDIGPGTWLLKMVPWSAAEHRIKALSADRKTSEALNIPTGTACLVIDRRTWGNSVYITYVRVTYPGEGYELVAQFSPSL